MCATKQNLLSTLEDIRKDMRKKPNPNKDIRFECANYDFKSGCCKVKSHNIGERHNEFRDRVFVNTFRTGCVNSACPKFTSKIK